MKPKLLLSIFFSVWAYIVNAQNTSCNKSITGNVLDADTKEPIHNALIKVKGTKKYTTTDSKGNFKLNGLCSTKNTIIISCGGYDDSTQNHIHNDSDIHFYLTEKVTGLNEVTIKARIKNETKTAQESIIKVKTLENYSSLSLGDALKEVPGVSSMNTGSTIVKPIINGLHSSRVLIINNGVRLQDQEWGIEHAPNIDINIASQISVIKGAGALAYGGDAIGGVVVVNPSKIISKDTLYGRTIIGGQTNGKGYNISSTFNKNYSSGWFGQIQGSYKKNGDFKTPDYYLTNTGLDAKSISARFGKKTFESGFETYYSYIDNEIGILRSAHIGNIQNLATAINSPAPLFTNNLGYDIINPKQEVKHHLFKSSYYKRFKNFGKVDVQYDYQNNRRFEFDIRRGGRSIKPAVDLKLQTHTISANTKINNNIERKYNFGVLTRYQNHFANPDTGVRRLIPDYDKYDFGFYTTAEWILSDNLIADTSIRYDFSRIDALKFYRTSDWKRRNYDDGFRDIIVGSVIGGVVVDNVINPNARKYLTNPVFDFHNISTAFGFKYKLNKNNQITLGYNLASRAPNPSELFSDGVHHSAARYEIGNLRINSEHSHRFYTTYGYTSSKFNFQVEGYYNYINNFIYLIPSSGVTTTSGVSSAGIIPTIRGPFPSWEYVQTNATLFGADINADYQITSHLNIKHKSAFIKGYDKKANLPLLDIPAFTTTNAITYKNTNWYNFNTSLKSEWMFEQNEFPTEYNYTVPIANASDIEVDLSPPTGYHLMHFQSEVTLSTSKKSSLNIMFSVNNIFNTNYRNYLNRLRFFANDMGRNFRLKLQLNY